MDRKLILFVEDSEHDREIYGKLLWYNGFDVEFACTGEEGLGFLEKQRPRLLMLDLHLPGVSGVEVCERVRADERTADLPVVILTGRPKREFAEWADSMGCAGFLEKPITPLEVLHEVERLIGRAPLPGEQVAAARLAAAAREQELAARDELAAWPRDRRNDVPAVRPIADDAFAARRRVAAPRVQPPAVVDPTAPAAREDAIAERPAPGNGIAPENPPVA